MILAGIDEAGYGPLLGPLVVGYCAFELGDVPADELSSDRLPCVWKRLRKLVSRTRARNGTKLHVNDSKLVYSPSNGLKELERSVLALLASAGGDGAVAGLDAVVASAAGHAVPDLAGYPWYRPCEGETFPLEQDAMAVRVMANALRQEMDKSQAWCRGMGARVVCERQLNQLCNATRNKASALFSTAAIHIDHLLRTYGHQDLTIVCDRQGGRERYGQLLRLMFEEWSLEVTRETEPRSEYRLIKGTHAVRIIFAEKAEAQCLPVAAASMLSKYLREALMRRFNAFWQRHLPDLSPTAGYYGDGSRFLQDIDVKRRELGVCDADLIRSR